MPADRSLTDRQWKILGYLEHSSDQIKQTPMVISFNLAESIDTVKDELDVLQEEGLVRETDQHPSVYRISPVGSRLCDGRQP